MSAIFTDRGAERGARTRLFRDCANGNGVEWIYAVDFAAGHDRWFGWGMASGESIERMRREGFKLEAHK